MRAANDRKVAVFSENDGDSIVAGTEQQDRAMFSGFDIEYGELASTSTHIAEFYSHNAHNLGLRPLFISAWCDGLLTGLLLASLPPTESGDTEVTGPGDEYEHQYDPFTDEDGNYPECGYKDPPCIYCQNGQRCPYK